LYKIKNGWNIFIESHFSNIKCHYQYFVYTDLIVKINPLI